jgi:glutamate dehydrogenase/leucine dehydrogenase
VRTGTNGTHPSRTRFRIQEVEREELTGRAVAVAGSGNAGLVAAYVLSDRDRGDGTVVAVDSSFLVPNDGTYPRLWRRGSPDGTKRGSSGTTWRHPTPTTSSSPSAVETASTQRR